MPFIRDKIIITPVYNKTTGDDGLPPRPPAAPPAPVPPMAPPIPVPPESKPAKKIPTKAELQALSKEELADIVSGLIKFSTSLIRELRDTRAVVLSPKKKFKSPVTADVTSRASMFDEIRKFGASKLKKAKAGGETSTTVITPAVPSMVDELTTRQAGAGKKAAWRTRKKLSPVDNMIAKIVELESAVTRKSGYISSISEKEATVRAKVAEFRVAEAEFTSLEAKMKKLQGELDKLAKEFADSNKSLEAALEAVIRGESPNLGQLVTMRQRQAEFHKITGEIKETKRELLIKKIEIDRLGTEAKEMTFSLYGTRLLNVLDKSATERTEMILKKMKEVFGRIDRGTESLISKYKKDIKELPEELREGFIRRIEGVSVGLASQTAKISISIKKALEASKSAIASPESTIPKETEKEKVPVEKSASTKVLAKPKAVSKPVVPEEVKVKGPEKAAAPKHIIPPESDVELDAQFPILPPPYPGSPRLSADLELKTKLAELEAQNAALKAKAAEASSFWGAVSTIGESIRWRARQFATTALITTYKIAEVATTPIVEGPMGPMSFVDIALLSSMPGPGSGMER